MQENIYELVLAEHQKQELQRVLACNEKTEQFGLILTDADAGMLIACRKDTLKHQRRVELGEGILPKLIYAFCDSQYINQEIYANTMASLQEVFYLYKNESDEELTDDELIAFMREQFDGVCFGSIEYLEETCLERFARAIRAGYCGHRDSEGLGEYEQFSEEARWDRSLFLQELDDLLV